MCNIVRGTLRINNFIASDFTVVVVHMTTRNLNLS